MSVSLLTESSPGNKAWFQSAGSLGRISNQPNLPGAKVVAGFVLERRTAELLKNKLADLTSREVEILRRIADGNANKETASALGIHIKTVEKHREHLMQKLNIHNTAGLTRYAICAGVFENSIQLMTD